MRYAEIPPEVQQAFMRQQLWEAERIRKYGHVRPTLSMDFQGHKFVAVGNAFYYDKSWNDMVLEDEGGSVTKHCEFTATHKETGLKYSVEAKSRHRPGILGNSGVPKPLSEIEAAVFRLLQSALLKKADHDRIIFVDVNVPPNGMICLETQLLNKIVEQVTRLEERQTPDNPWPPAFIVFTNHPYHYVGHDQPAPEANAVFSPINMPHLKVPDPAYSSKYPAYARLFHSVLHHTAIPQDFQSINTAG